MKRISAVIGCAMLSACSHYQVSITQNSHEQEINQKMMMPASWAAQVVWSMKKHHAEFPKDLPLVVTTPVAAEDFNQSASFTNQLQQELMTAFSRAGYIVAEPNVADRLMIKANGEFVLSRDWQELSGDLDIGLLVVTTYSLGLANVKLNTRVINVQNNQVVAAESSVIPVSSLGQFLSPAEKVIEKDGILYRNESAGMAQLKDKKGRP
ncbi:FlgO family outer membrane protein [Parashewanella tropica]|uniref:FlgO family outer membrane protein n=1 Tax=Parashewanella tropica TaxID=2547970 RepID=UPI0010595CF0|nr:FlgO family outer membrane protein [Parashewanella tropica]